MALLISSEYIRGGKKSKGCGKTILGLYRNGIKQDIRFECVSGNMFKPPIGLFRGIPPWESREARGRSQRIVCINQVRPIAFVNQEGGIGEFMTLHPKRNEKPGGIRIKVVKKGASSLHKGAMKGRIIRRNSRKNS